MTMSSRMKDKKKSKGTIEKTFFESNKHITESWKYKRK